MRRLDQGLGFVEQLLAQLLAGPQTGHFDLDVLFGPQSGQADDLPRQIHDIDRIAHVQNVDLAGLLSCM